MKKLISLLVLVAMVATMAVACGGNDAPAETTAKPGTDPVTEGATEPVTTVDDYAHDLPADLKFDGKELILGTYVDGNISQGWAHFLDVDEPWSGNLVEEAAYARNFEVEQLLGITITCIEDWGWQQGLNIALEVCTQAGVARYDVMFLESIFSYESLIIDELLVDVERMPYMDLTKDYYNKQFNDVYYLRDSLYFFVSDLTFPCQSAVQWLVNDDMLADLGYASNYLFEKVESGDWNLSVVWDMIDGVAVDVNADGVEDRTDKYGIGGDTGSLSPLWPAAGLKGCYYTEDGFEFDYGTDFSFEVYNEILELKTSPDVFGNDWGNDPWLLGNALFTMSGQELRILQSMDFEFSVLPLPRFNDEQDRYYNYGSGGVTMIPANIDDENLVGAAVEALACASGKHLVPAFHDNFIEQGVLRNTESWNNWNRMLKEWAAPEFCSLISPDGRLTWFKPVYESLWANDPGFQTSWDAMKESVAESCWIFYDFYLSELGA
jgi:ABC-type glycerol-3-phosphate transport system substrate-binding protein